MKVKDLLEELKDCKEEYGEDFLDWDVAVEHHEKPEECPNCRDNMFTDSEGWTYIKCHGYWTKFTKKRVFTVNIHY